MRADAAVRTLGRLLLLPGALFPGLMALSPWRCFWLRTGGTARCEHQQRQQQLATAEHPPRWQQYGHCRATKAARRALPTQYRGASPSERLERWPRRRASRLRAQRPKSEAHLFGAL